MPKVQPHTVRKVPAIYVDHAGRNPCQTYREAEVLFDNDACNYCPEPDFSEGWGRENWIWYIWGVRP